MGTCTTPYTANCLLPYRCSASPQELEVAGISWLSGYYQLAPGAAPQYSGGISLFRAAAAGNGASSALQFSEVTLETDAGIFDMTTTTTTAAAAGVAGPGGAPTRVEGGKAVLACCTDGSLRVWQPPSSTANPSLTTIAEGISEHMITSCSEIPSEDGMFLCTAHQGECLVVTTASSNTGHEMVTQQQQQQPPPPPERQHWRCWRKGYSATSHLASPAEAAATPSQECAGGLYQQRPVRQVSNALLARSLDLLLLLLLWRAGEPTSLTLKFRRA